jgi:hypothetical protein
VLVAAAVWETLPVEVQREVTVRGAGDPGEQRLNGLLARGGFGRVRRATQTPFNILVEARSYPAAKERRDPPTPPRCVSVVLQGRIVGAFGVLPLPPRMHA